MSKITLLLQEVSVFVKWLLTQMLLPTRITAPAYQQATMLENLFGFYCFVFFSQTHLLLPRSHQIKTSEQSRRKTEN